MRLCWSAVRCRGLILQKPGGEEGRRKQEREFSLTCDVYSTKPAEYDLW